MHNEVLELVTRLAEDADTSRSRLLEQLVGQEHEAYERLTQLATSAELELGFPSADLAAACGCRSFVSHSATGENRTSGSVCASSAGQTWIDRP